MSMVCGVAAMTLLDPSAFQHLENLGQRVRTGIDEAFDRTGIPGQTTGLGSLIKIHFTDTPLHDYRSAIPSVQSARMLDAFTTALLNEGLLTAKNGLMALSTPMTVDDCDVIVAAIERALKRLTQ
jgi:glutamate-1-semialdehyde 2,1-aminomutase